MTSTDDDVVRSLLRLIARELAPQVPAKELWRLDRMARDLWGGQRHYIRRQAPPIAQDPPQRAPGAAIGKVDAPT